jgi:5'(3')-deoxyribonucleotidase
VDIDGVVADSVRRWVELHNQDHNTNYTIEDVTDYDFNQCAMPFKAMEQYYTRYDGVVPVKGSLESIDVLKTKYRIVFATSGYGADWLDFYILQPEIIQIKDKSLLRGYALIDDYPLNLDGFIGVRYLHRQPWNTNRGLNDVTWKEITEHLMEAKV